VLFKKPRYSKKVVKVSAQEIEKHLLPFGYYESLSEKGKEKFLHRILQLRSYLKFIGKEELEITEQMRLRISASLVQLTFGFEQFFLPAFRKVLVYPQKFYHAGWKKWMKGFTSGNGVVALSWYDFQHGYYIEDDNYNLGLHELAHALHVNLKTGFDSDPVFEYYFINWEEKSSKEFENISKDSDHFLREYGGTNMHEFFAVCVEHFFESPKAFNEALPDLYTRTQLLLNQNPLNAKGDYILDGINKYNPDGSEFVTLERAKYKEASWHWSLTLSFIGIFISPIVIFMTLMDALILPVDVFKTVGMIAIIGAVQYPWFKHKGWYDYKLFFVMYCIAGVGINAVALGSIANRAFTVKKEMRVEEVIGQRPIDYNTDKVILRDEYYNSFSHLMKVQNQRGKITKVKMHVYTGILGIQRIQNLHVFEKIDVDD